MNTARNIQIIKTELNEGRCVMLGILVYQSFMTQAVLRSGVVPVPNRRQERLLGGHAIALSGWDDTKAVFTFRNSWGTSVGKQGSFAIPYSYVCNPTLAGDVWVVDIQ
jgi:C1A family cysteine protease